MKKLLCGLLGALLTLSTSCARQNTILGADDIKDLREQYPYCDTSSSSFDMTIQPLSVILQRKDDNFGMDFAEIEIVEDAEKEVSEYQLDPNSSEAALDKKVGGSGVLTVNYLSYKAKIIDDLGNKIPDRVYDENGYVAFIIGSNMAFLVPDLKVGERYCVSFAIYNEDSTIRPDKVNDLHISGGGVYYLTDNKYILASVQERDEHTGMSLRNFKNQITEMLENNKE